LPGSLTGLRFSVSIAWLLLIVGEQINARAGLGYLMNQAREFFEIDIIVVGLVVYGILGLVGDAGVRMLERTMLGWRQTFHGT
jgi:sulfonate transport system permease protein